jgi:hypothetical protein
VSQNIFEEGIVIIKTPVGIFLERQAARSVNKTIHFPKFKFREYRNPDKISGLDGIKTPCKILFTISGTGSLYFLA